MRSFQRCICEARFELGLFLESIDLISIQSHNIFLLVCIHSNHYCEQNNHSLKLQWASSFIQHACFRFIQIVHWKILFLLVSAHRESFYNSIRLDTDFPETRRLRTQPDMDDFLRNCRSSPPHHSFCVLTLKRHFMYWFRAKLDCGPKSAKISNLKIDKFWENIHTKSLMRNPHQSKKA